MSHHDTLSKVLEFHEAFGCAIGERPALPPCNGTPTTTGGFALAEARDAFREQARRGDAGCLRLALITEELLELADALDDRDLEGALDALVDLRYVLDGMVITLGLHTPYPDVNAFEAAFARVHAANMRKLHDGVPCHDPSGKIIKPPGWVAADLGDLVL